MSHASRLTGDGVTSRIHEKGKIIKNNTSQLIALTNEISKFEKERLAEGYIKDNAGNLIKKDNYQTTTINLNRNNGEYKTTIIKSTPTTSKKESYNEKLVKVYSDFQKNYAKAIAKGNMQEANEIKQTLNKIKSQLTPQREEKYYIKPDKTNNLIAPLEISKGLYEKLSKEQKQIELKNKLDYENHVKMNIKTNKPMFSFKEEQPTQKIYTFKQYTRDENNGRKTNKVETTTPNSKNRNSLRSYYDNNNWIKPNNVNNSIDKNKLKISKDQTLTNIQQEVPSLFKSSMNEEYEKKTFPGLRANTTGPSKLKNQYTGSEMGSTIIGNEQDKLIAPPIGLPKIKVLKYLNVGQNPSIQSREHSGNVDYNTTIKELNKYYFGDKNSNNDMQKEGILKWYWTKVYPEAMKQKYNYLKELPNEGIINTYNQWSNDEKINTQQKHRIDTIPLAPITDYTSLGLRKIEKEMEKIKNKIVETEKLLKEEKNPNKKIILNIKLKNAGKYEKLLNEMHKEGNAETLANLGIHTIKTGRYLAETPQAAMAYVNSNPIEVITTAYAIASNPTTWANAKNDADTAFQKYNLEINKGPAYIGAVALYKGKELAKNISKTTKEYYDYENKPTSGRIATALDLYALYKLATTIRGKSADIISTRGKKDITEIRTLSGKRKYTNKDYAKMTIKDMEKALNSIKNDKKLQDIISKRLKINKAELKWEIQKSIHPIKYWKRQLQKPNILKKLEKGKPIEKIKYDNTKDAIKDRIKIELAEALRPPQKKKIKQLFKEGIARLKTKNLTTKLKPKTKKQIYEGNLINKLLKKGAKGIVSILCFCCVFIFSSLLH